jgi:hypothetical protein
MLFCQGIGTRYAILTHRWNGCQTRNIHHRFVGLTKHAAHDTISNDAKPLYPTR